MVAHHVHQPGREGLLWPKHHACPARVLLRRAARLLAGLPAHRAASAQGGRHRRAERPDGRVACAGAAGGDGTAGHCAVRAVHRRGRHRQGPHLPGLDDGVLGHPQSAVGHCPHAGGHDHRLDAVPGGGHGRHGRGCRGHLPAGPGVRRLPDRPYHLERATDRPRRARTGRWRFSPVAAAAVVFGRPHALRIRTRIRDGIHPGCQRFRSPHEHVCGHGAPTGRVSGRDHAADAFRGRQTLRHALRRALHSGGVAARGALGPRRADDRVRLHHHGNVGLRRLRLFLLRPAHPADWRIGAAPVRLGPVRHPGGHPGGVRAGLGARRPRFHLDHHRMPGLGIAHHPRRPLRSAWRRKGSDLCCGQRSRQRAREPRPRRRQPGGQRSTSGVRLRGVRKAAWILRPRGRDPQPGGVRVQRPRHRRAALHRAQHRQDAPRPPVPQGRRRRSPGRSFCGSSRNPAALPVRPPTASTTLLRDAPRAAPSNQSDSGALPRPLTVLSPSFALVLASDEE